MSDTVERAAHAQHGRTDRPRGMNSQRNVRPVVEPSSLHALVVQFKAQRLHQVQHSAKAQAGAADSASIGGDHGVHKHDMQ